MQIYNLVEPETPTYKGSPLDTKPSVGLPGVICEACRQTWVNISDRIPRDLPSDHPLRSRKRGPVPVSEFNLLQADVRMALNLPLDTPLVPGTRIGVLDLTCKDPHLASFEWPAVHVLIVQEEVVDYLREQKIAGWEVAPVRIEGTRHMDAIPPMYQLFVTGNGGIPVTDPPVEKISHCDVCGRTEYRRGNPRSFQIDPSQWDGSEIFRFGGGYEGYIFITDRLADGFRAAGFQNYGLASIESFLERRAPYVIA